MAVTKPGMVEEGVTCRVRERTLDTFPLASVTQMWNEYAPGEAVVTLATPLMVPLVFPERPATGVLAFASDSPDGSKVSISSVRHHRRLSERPPLCANAMDPWWR